MTTIWAVANTDYDNTSTVAVFTTEELAQQHAAQRDEGEFEVIEHDILDRLPVKVTLVYRSASVYVDGRVERLNRSSRPQEYWDFEAPGRVNIRRWERRTDVGVYADPGTVTAELLEQIDMLLDDYAIEGRWTEEMLSAAKLRARGERPPAPVSRCYRTPSGIAVHVKAGCVC